MKRILREPEPEFDTDSVPDTEPKVEQGTTQTVDSQNSLDALDIHMIGAAPLA